LSGYLIGVDSKTPELHPSNQPDLTDLFLTFLRIGLLGFGGVLAVSRIELVDKKGWLSEQEFVEMLGICNFLPGANVVSLAVFVGGINQGLMGSVVAFIGLISAPIVIIIVLAHNYTQWIENSYFRASLSMMASCGAGIIVAIAIRLFQELEKSLRYLLTVGVIVTCVSVLGLSIIPVVMVVAPIAMFLEAREK
tara:strand:+ start:1772 stop:2353 length:582 start_codon:yes stop_codon:yes gene_type:complete